MMINPTDIYRNSRADIGKQKEFGEVFTPDKLINEMLDTLPVSVWRNLNLKWLDPAAGAGNFFAIVYNRLMEQLEPVIKNKAARRKHILEKMLYFVEIQDSSVEAINRIFNPDGSLRLNVFNGDFAMFNENTFSVKRFDIVLGNPPYQMMHTSAVRKAKNHNSWSLFIEKGFDLVAEKGFLLYVTPPAWMSPSSKLLEKIFLKYQLHFVNIDECSRHFIGIGSKFSYYLIQKTPVYAPTKFVYEFKGGSKISSLKGESTYQLHPGIKFIPQLPTEAAFSILEKTVFSKNPKFQILYDSDLHRFTKKHLLSDVKDEQFKYKIIHTPSQVVWGSRPHKYQGKIKVLIPLTTYFEKMMVDRCGNTQGMGYILCKDDEEAQAIKHVLSTRVYRFIANITRWSNFNVPLVMQNLPLYPLEKTINDTEINNFFGLSRGDIAALELVNELSNLSPAKARSMQRASELRQMAIFS